MHNCHIKNIKHDFDLGYNHLINKDLDPDINIDFAILRLTAGQKHDFSNKLEGFCLLMTGEVDFFLDGITHTAKRSCLFRQQPHTAHWAAGSSIKVIAKQDSELAVGLTPNDKHFPALFFGTNDLAENEHRGKGLLNDTSYRMVRTIFDTRNRSQSQLVLGEVINFPGRWSSYPPHHHQHPEIYHYRFSEVKGYGHAELGDDVFKVYHGDTVKILDSKDHAQVAAPGYAMYYIWLIRHLPGNPYIAPTFTHTHAWTKEASANNRVWQVNNHGTEQ